MTKHNNFIYKIIKKDLVDKKYLSIHTRFPPEPNGYLHIGHAKSICLNFGIADYYNGRCNLRFDDTNPDKENIKFTNAIKKDLKWLGFNWYGKVRYTSDYFNQFYKYAIELINKGLAYVDELDQEEIHKYRGTLKTIGENSPYRNRSIKENLKLFKKMKDGKFAEGSACLRAKINMSSKIIILRDPVLYRIKFTEHYRTGNRWCIYPTYDFAHCVSDAIENITHSLCTLEFQENRKLYNWILRNISIQSYPNQYEFSRLNLEYTLTSKRKLAQLVDSKIVDGWDDPRMPTISGLRRRGYTSSAIREFCNLIGVTKQDSLIKISCLESCIRKDLNRNAPRLMAVINPIKVIIENLPEDYSKKITILKHPHKPEMGIREILLSREIWIDYNDFSENASDIDKKLALGTTVRLRGACNIKAIKIEKNQIGEISRLFCIVDLDSLNYNSASMYKTTKIVHWVSVKHSIPAQFRIYERLFDTNCPNKDPNFLLKINSKSLTICHGYVESSIKKDKKHQTWQFERVGYFCLDSVHSKSSKLVFNRIVPLV